MEPNFFYKFIHISHTHVLKTGAKIFEEFNQAYPIQNLRDLKKIVDPFVPQSNNLVIFLLDVN